MYPGDIIHLLWEGFYVIKGPGAGPIAKKCEWQNILLNLHICILTQCFLGPEFFSVVWKKAVLNLGIKRAECSFVQILIGFKDFFGYVIPWKSPISELWQKNIFGTGNFKYGKWTQNLHFQKHHILYLWFYSDVMFFVFWFLHFLCKFEIPREQCAKKTSDKVGKNDILEKKIPM